jgi:hypothetical protein
MEKVKYSCIAVPPEGIKLNTVYEVGKDEKGYFYTDGNTKTYEDEKIINMLFSAIETPKKSK